LVHNRIETQNSQRKQRNKTDTARQPIHSIQPVQSFNHQNYPEISQNRREKRRKEEYCSARQSNVIDGIPHKNRQQGGAALKKQLFLPADFFLVVPHASYQQNNNPQYQAPEIFGQQKAGVETLEYCNKKYYSYTNNNPAPTLRNNIFRLQIIIK